MKISTNAFKEKREDLELFIREQIIGPGAFNKRFFFIDKWGDNEFSGKSLEQCQGIDNLSEVIAEVPAYQYSSGILFPISVAHSDTATVENITDENLLSPDEEDQPLHKSEDEEFVDDQTESISSKNQNYPNTCGLAFAVDSSRLLSNDIEVTVSFRKYQKIKQTDAQELRLGYWVQFHKEEITEVIANYFSGILETVVKGTNLFVCFRKGVNIDEQLYDLDYINLNRLLQEKVLPLIISLFPNKEFFKHTHKEYQSVNYAISTLYEDSLIEEIIKDIKEDKTNYQKYKLLITWIEIYKNTRSIISDLKTIFRKSSKKNFPIPIWESQPFSKKVVLPNFDSSKKVVREELAIEGCNELKLNYQYIRSDNNSTYIKLIIVNKAIIKIKENEPPQLNKKDKANEMSFFGVKLEVKEVAQNTLVPYNPPNLSRVDQEDNFNKLIYRNYKDYAEGYNTSVTWGTDRSNHFLKFISTEFLPAQETPNVDFKPSKIEGDEVVDLIDMQVLSMRNLSTLSKKSDIEVIKSLKEFVCSYKIWIDDQRDKLAVDTSLKDGKELLGNQLNACEVDFRRLDRNIELLEKDKKGLAAFRIMNTAMFMQLHHSKGIKTQKPHSFTPDENSESFYKAVFLEQEYRWRSFQLAFILLNVDAFIRPSVDDRTVEDVFGTGWPERNELADLVWFPTGGGKTEAYLGIIAFTIAYRRFVKGESESKGTTVLMRYTLRLLTLQQFQRATLLICALEVIRKDSYKIPHECSLGNERISIGLFVGQGSLPNTWEQMKVELDKISDQLKNNPDKKINTNLPHTECPWCGGKLFVSDKLNNVEPKGTDRYGINHSLKIMCNSSGCSFFGKRPNENGCLPFKLFDEDIYKNPPTLLFGTVDKFAALANKASTLTDKRNQDSRRLLGKGYDHHCFPPELIIQDELHLLLGPLGSAVALFEKSIDELCTYTEGIKVRPKIITSTATTRNTDKQIFALFNRRSEIFPKQGILCDDSFFAFYKRKEGQSQEYDSNRKYVGILPVGKTQVWMQLRIASICLAHRVKMLREKFTLQEIVSNNDDFDEYEKVADYYHTVLSYFNSLKEVGKTQSQLSHYLPGDLNLVSKNTFTWSFINRIIKQHDEIVYSELTGRLSGEEVKTNLSSIDSTWKVFQKNHPPEFVISTNMISVGIDVSRFNMMIINSMPRNTAEYIQASSRVARDKEGIVLTIHHPFRSRDISHYQRFKEFHEKFYSYVEPISITPFANKALERYFAMFLAVMIRHNETLELSNNDSAGAIDEERIRRIKELVYSYIIEINRNAERLNGYLRNRRTGISLNVEGIIGSEEMEDIKDKLDELLIVRWFDRLAERDNDSIFSYKDNSSESSLFKPRRSSANNANWNVKESLREIAPSVVIKTVQQ